MPYDNLLVKSDRQNDNASKTLTDFEIIGLSSSANLADGHAYQDLITPYAYIPNILSSIWSNSSGTPIPEREREFKDSYANLIKSPALGKNRAFKIAPTASNAIDIIGAFLRLRSIRTALVEPTFDNLALLLRRREVDLTPFSSEDLALVETGLRPSEEVHKNTQAIFLVNPNNPTGEPITKDGFSEIIKYCTKHKKLLLVDNSFRLFRREIYDDYEMLFQSGVSFISFEDTGKCFPTQDMKASLLLYSNDNRTLIEEIYNEIYLCTSNFTLGVLLEFFDATARTGLEDTLWTLVDERRSILRKTIAGSQLQVDPAAVDSRSSVEWLDCSGLGKDIEVCRQLKDMDLVVLPGRNFYWNSLNLSHRHHNIRLSLLKPTKNFERSVSIIASYLEQQRILL